MKTRVFILSSLYAVLSFAGPAALLGDALRALGVGSISCRLSASCVLCLHAIHLRSPSHLAREATLIYQLFSTRERLSIQ